MRLRMVARECKCLKFSVTRCILTRSRRSFVYSGTWMFVFKGNYCAFAYGST